MKSIKEKAEERAFEAYPKISRISEPHGIIPADNESHYIGDANVEKQEGFIEGYHQAEKDNELTLEDIKAIDKLLNQCVDYSNPYQELLKRFKSYGKKEI